MPKILTFTKFSLRDFLIAAGPAMVAIVVTCLLAYWLVDPFPPPTITIGTGQENSAYEEFGKKYARALEKFGIHVILKRSLGSRENLLRLEDPKSGVDVAFVQSGSTDQEESANKGLMSLGSLFTEPVWLFFRDTRKITSLTQLKGLKRV